MKTLFQFTFEHPAYLLAGFEADKPTEEEIEKAKTRVIVAFEELVSLWKDGYLDMAIDDARELQRMDTEDNLEYGCGLSFVNEE